MTPGWRHRPKSDISDTLRAYARVVSLRQAKHACHRYIHSLLELPTGWRIDRIRLNRRRYFDRPVRKRYPVNAAGNRNGCRQHRPPGISHGVAGSGGESGDIDSLWLKTQYLHISIHQSRPRVNSSQRFSTNIGSAITWRAIALRDTFFCGYKTALERSGRDRLGRCSGRYFLVAA